MGRGKEFRGYFCPEQGLSALNFRGGAEKVVVHMHWLTWLLWRPILIRMNLLHIVSTCLKDIMAFVLRMEGL